MNNLKKQYCLLFIAIIFSLSVNGAIDCPIFKVQIKLNNNIILNGYTQICGGDTDYVNRGMSFLDYVRNSHDFSGLDTLIVYKNLYFLKPLNFYTFSRDEGEKISLKQIKDATMISVILNFNFLNPRRPSHISPLPGIKEIEKINKYYVCMADFNFNEDIDNCYYTAISCNPSVNEAILKNICTESKKRYLDLYKSKNWDNTYFPEKMEIDHFNNENYKKGIFLFNFCDEY